MIDMRSFEDTDVRYKLYKACLRLLIYNLMVIVQDERAT